ncbi:MAG: tetratricopeptide repeat protein [bacterium]|nr:tetratricopeptide repeat protein [bacterium]
MALKFYVLTENNIYKGTKSFLEESFSVKSPYTYWQVRKEAGWQFLKVLEDRVEETMASEDIRAIKDIYDFIVPELEKLAENRPYEPQIYYVLGRIYRFGFEKLGQDDLDKAEIILKKGLKYSDLRMEYFNDLSYVLLWQGKFEEAEKLLKDYVARVDFHDYFPYLFLGHFYFEAEKYDLAMEQYEKAREAGYDFCEVPAEYSRYMFSAEKTEEYQRIVALAKKYLERWGPEADTYFNIAVGYLNLNEKEKAKEFFLKALELNPEYEQYRLFFVD